MSDRQYRLRGTTAAITEYPSLAELKAAKAALHWRQHSIRPGLARDGATEVHAVDADDVVRVELDNGFVLWTRAEDLFREHGSVGTARDAAPVWELDRLRPAVGSVAGSRDERGIIGLAIKALDFFGYDLTERTARKLCAEFEKKTFTRSGLKEPGGGPGLYACALDAGEPRVIAKKVSKVPAGDAPVLIFIHGTFSSFSGTFGKLWDKGNIEGAATRARLKQVYGDRVYAYEHRSLTESPLQNAVELAAVLPAGANVHLVTHSRGGLVGELLCLCACENFAATLNEQQLAKLFASDRTDAPGLNLGPLAAADAKLRDEAYRKDLAFLKQLLGFKLNIQRFVRVAAPARGTTLASGRLDRWLSVLNDLTARAFQVPIFDDAMDFLFAVVKERTDPRTLPGLEAMMPGSAVTRLLNHPALVSTSDLTIIAGDIEGDSLWQRFKILLTDWFYGAEHDLVVNTGSMVGGLKRPPNGARYAKDQGPSVDHFHYFSNSRTVKLLEAGLTRQPAGNAGFILLTEVPKREPQWLAAVARSRAATDRRPLAIVIPGTMGSHLKVDSDHVWLNYGALLFGGLERLGWGAKSVEPADVIEDFYGPLIEFLARTHRVEVFAYDWRDSVLTAAGKLASKLNDWLPRAETEQQAVHIVAHSMGGLVTRAMIASPVGAALWQRIKRLPNSRLLMLGTPNRGSYEAVRWLTGFNSTEGKLALLDFDHDMNEIIDIVRQYPGLLELLPFGDNDVDFTEAKRWLKLKTDLGAAWNTADATQLRDAGATWKLMKAQAGDKDLMRYVAGCQPATVTGYRVEQVDPPLLPPYKRLEFDGSRHGDGTVTWDSGRLDNVPMWYAEDTAHDNLCAQQRAFVGYLDLLTTGTTTRLPSAPPAANRDAAGVAVSFPMPLSAAAYLPGEQETVQLGFGGASAIAPTASTNYAPQIEVTMRHGDLSYARDPVLVGHYIGDTIVSAEAVLDRQLAHALSKRLELGIYPGPLGTHASFFSDGPLSRPKGAIVLGLGQVGDLSPALLESAATAALLEFALRVGHWPDDRFGSRKAARSAAVSCLFVGSGAGGLSIRDSIESMLRAALTANERLVAAELNHVVLIDRIEFIEVFLDVAIAACDALRATLAAGPLAMNVRWDGTLHEGKAALRRVRFDDAPEWWQRLEILEEKSADASLRFIYSTDRARAEETVSTGQLRLAESFISEASRSASSNLEAARTLYEMLLPLRLREAAPRQQNLVLLLDKYSARFPWELLENRWGQTGRPPAVQSGVLRQLKALDFREQPAHSDAPTALVVGNPNLEGSPDFAELPGARQEAQTVATLLETQGGFQVLDSIDEKKDDILYKLHRRAWRILHLAGHGVHEFEISRQATPVQTTCGATNAERPLRVSGMVIGPQDFLTPGDIKQLRWVPELVFVNCCHLGNTLARHQLDRPGFAANLGVAFINMGARAVVVAGWAVDDSAANTFAETFYSRMLEGQYFGEAVRLAREATHDRHPDVNTWGAYQCYGDPNFSLVRPASSSHRPLAPFATSAELVNALDNCASALLAGNTPHDSDPVERIQSILARVPPAHSDWTQSGDCAAALGLAYGEAGKWALALAALNVSVAAERGYPSLRVLEQRANYRARLAVETFGALRGVKTKDLARNSAAPIAEIETSIDELERLCSLGDTSERRNLLGAACKRLALLHGAVNDDARCEAALKKMMANYGAALENSLGAGKHGAAAAYSYSNWATAKLLLSMRAAKPVSEKTVDFETTGAQLVADVRQRYDLDPDFWNSTALGDLAFVHVLAQAPDLEADTVELTRRVAEIREAYNAPLARGASPRQRSSLCENLDFVITVMRAAPHSTKKPGKGQRQVANKFELVIAALELLRDELAAPAA